MAKTKLWQPCALDEFGATIGAGDRWRHALQHEKFVCEAMDEEPVSAWPIDGVLDLHAFLPRDAQALVHDYLNECVRLQIGEVRIIHGKGNGTLRRIVHAALSKRSDVIAFALAPAERGGWGATLVTLRLY